MVLSLSHFKEKHLSFSLPFPTAYQSVLQEIQPRGRCQSGVVSGHLSGPLRESLPPLAGTYDLPLWPQCPDPGGP